MSDGAFAESDSLGNIQLEPALVEHALGLFLFTELVNAKPENRTEAIERLTAIMEPLAGFDQEAHIFRGNAISNHGFTTGDGCDSKCVRSRMA